MHVVHKIIKWLFLKNDKRSVSEDQKICLYNIYKWIYDTVGLVIIKGEGVISTMMSRFFEITLTTPLPSEHETLNQCWVDVGPTS